MIMSVLYRFLILEFNLWRKTNSDYINYISYYDIIFNTAELYLIINISKDKI